MRNSRRDGSERGAALLVAIVAIAILTLLGLALALVTSMEQTLAATEGHVNKAFYSADAGIQWTAARMIEAGPFLTKSEFRLQGFTEFRLPDHTPSEDPAALHITVRVDQPELLGRRFFVGGSLNVQRKQYIYDYQVLSQSRNNFLSANKAIRADVEVGPLPDVPPGFVP